MANEFITVKEIARQVLPRLIENLVFPNLIHKDFSEEYVTGKGATIQVKKPVILTAKEFNEAEGTSAQDVKEESVPIEELLQNCDLYTDREVEVPKVVD